MKRIAKLDFTHTDGDGSVLFRLIFNDGSDQHLGSLTKNQALDAMQALAEAIRMEFAHEPREV